MLKKLTMDKFWRQIESLEEDGKIKQGKKTQSHMQWVPNLKNRTKQNKIK